MIKKIPLIIVSLISIFANYAYSQNIITNIKINPLNRITFYYKGNDIDYSIMLSDDKKQIEFKIKNATIAPQFTNITSEGIIKNIVVSKPDNTLIINLKEARGYTALKMDMSNSIIFEVFDWNKLNSNEEHYRNALLAIEDEIYSVAHSELNQIKLRDYPNAAAILGIMQLKSGNIATAKENLLLAANSNTNIPDVFSALAQIYEKESNTKQNEYYLNKFYEITGSRKYSPIIIGNISLNDSAKYDSLSYLSNIQKHSNDTSNIASSNDSAKSSNLVTSNSSQASKGSAIADNKILIYVIFAIVVLTIMLFSTFIKWRKKQLNLLQTQSIKNKINDKENKFPNSEKIEYQKSANNKENSGINNSKIHNNNNITNEPPIHPALLKYLQNNSEIKVKEKTAKSPSPLKKDYKENQKEILNLLENILEKNKNKHILETTLEKEKDKYKKNPNLDLALSLQKKQQDIKAEKISNISEGTDSKSLQGINSNTINTKKKINNLEKNKSEIEKLAGKINKNE